MIMFSQFYVSVVLFQVCAAVYEDARCKCVCLDPSGLINGSKRVREVKAIAADKCTCDYMLRDKRALCPYCDCKYQVRNTGTIKVVVCLILTVISALTLYMIFLVLLEPLFSDHRLGRKSLFDVVHADLENSQQHAVPSSNIAVCEPAIMPNISSPWANSVFSNTQIFPRKFANSTVVWGKSYKGDEQLIDDELTLNVNSSREYFRKYTAPFVMSNYESPLQLRTIGTSGTSVSNVVTRVRDQQERWKGNVEAQRARVFSEHTLLN